ncbi:RNA-directed DNA polymerase from mobile element jockey [Eumeta japonica]|uniref:RNA-directed DNA polymerase from mobile element jockey n=1 Tax=Eumeta variegata TaxID=151549 RepID=A0A4C1YEF7_EUMVA|nr:RNA-directed DNA polymerase from mobile element jockey [Eumeta japonica]
MIYRDRRQVSSSRCSRTILPCTRAVRQSIASPPDGHRGAGSMVSNLRIEVNAEKSAAISFLYRVGRSPIVVARGTPPLRINNAPIPWQHTYKYLGITLDRNLHFRDHIKRVRKTAIFYQSRLKGMLGRNSKLSLRNKRTLYLMCIRTVLTYASPVFAHAAPNRLKLQVLQNKFCRTATDAHWCVKTQSFTGT